MKTLKRSIRGLSAMFVAGVLLFGATQAFASVDGGRMEYCPGTCPPLTPHMYGTCWDLCYNPPYTFGGDCDAGGDCCCFFK